jgi:hypothetical protein
MRETPRCAESLGVAFKGANEEESVNRTDGGGAIEPAQHQAGLRRFTVERLPHGLAGQRGCKVSAIGRCWSGPEIGADVVHGVAAGEIIFTLGRWERSFCQFGPVTPSGMIMSVRTRSISPWCAPKRRGFLPLAASMIQ